MSSASVSPRLTERTRPTSMASPTPGSPSYRKPAPVMTVEDLAALSAQHTKGKEKTYTTFAVTAPALFSLPPVSTQKVPSRRPRTAPSGPRKESPFFAAFQPQPTTSGSKNRQNSDMTSTIERNTFLRSRKASLSIDPPKTMTALDMTAKPTAQPTMQPTTQPVTAKASAADCDRKKSSLSNIFRGISNFMRQTRCPISGAESSAKVQIAQKPQVMSHKAALVLGLSVAETDSGPRRPSLPTYLGTQHGSDPENDGTSMQSSLDDLDDSFSFGEVLARDIHSPLPPLQQIRTSLSLESIFIYANAFFDEPTPSARSDASIHSRSSTSLSSSPSPMTPNATHHEDSVYHGDKNLDLPLYGKLHKPSQWMVAECNL